MISATVKRIKVGNGGQSGFTLIELLVVILIIGILAAIAIPSLVSQKSKANDASAKSLAQTAQTTIESYATDHDGSYAGVSAPSDLQSIEPSINITAGNGDAYLAVANGSANGFTIIAQAATNDQFSVVKNGATITRSCTGSGNGCVGGSW